MSALRILGLLILSAGLLAMGVESSAQVKMPPQIKPGVPPGGPPKPPVGDPGKGKPPVPPVGPPGMNPGVGVPPGVPGTPAVPPEKKKDDIKWPKEVNGKNLETTVKDIRNHPDPAIREAAIRALPQFGPKGREEGADDLIEAMTKDKDWNVKMAAVNVGPAIFVGLADLPDGIFNNGVTAICGFLGNDQFQVKLEALAAVAAVGPYIRKINPGIVGTITNTSRNVQSWQLRRAATVTLGSIGQGIQVSDDPEKRVPPDTAAVDALLANLKSDPCAAVRREDVNSLIGVGVVAAPQQKKWRSDLDLVLRSEKDKSVALWIHALIIRNDPNGVKGNEAHLDAIAKVLQAPEVGGRVEACQALGLLGEPDALTKLDDLIGVINKDGDANVVMAAILAITNMPSKDAATVPILQNVKATHANADVKQVASDAIEYLAGRKKKK